MQSKSAWAPLTDMAEAGPSPWAPLTNTECEHGLSSCDFVLTQIQPLWPLAKRLGHGGYFSCYPAALLSDK